MIKLLCAGLMLFHHAAGAFGPQFVRDRLPVVGGVFALCGQVIYVLRVHQGGFGDCDYAISFLRAGSVDYGESSGSNVPHTYTVMAGDTLWDIARRTLGDGASYGAIFDANYDAIVKSGGIRPGMTLTIPEVG